MNKPEIPAGTKNKQREASDPQRSAWVSANAGSGKTYVLTMRVIRLLLNGVAPEKILCLTYTKVAAANMATGIFRRLAQWTQLDDEALAREIEALGEKRPDAKRLKRARCLFAEAVETPGGLKIQTIHAFCERLLHLFPFEANVSASFSVIEEEEQALLLKKAQDYVLTFAEEPNLCASIAFLAQETSEDGLGELMNQALKRRSSFEELLRSGYPIAELGDDMREALGLKWDDSAESLKREMLKGGLSPTEISALAHELASIAISKRLAAIAGATDESERFQAYWDVFLTKTGGPLKSGFISDKQAQQYGAAASRLIFEQNRVLAILDKIRAAALVERTLALVTVVDAILARYKELNARLSKLDFDDLITRTQHLLVRPGSEWVLFKLDQGIDHILVDEAQDTSPPQWKVFAALADEIFAGQGQKPTTRSFFAVGDEKQSIYSFQGAAPHLFAENRKHFHGKAKGAQLAFSAVNLDLSFRSSATILATVDDVFEQQENARGLSFEEGAERPTHEALYRSLPGVVEIWPLPVKVPEVEAPDWRLPLDQIAASDPKLQLADQIASTIASWLDPDSRETITDKDSGQQRKIRAGDVLILVRSRNAFVTALNRALKQKNVPVAGSDRLKLIDHIGVLDLIAVGRVALLDLDDYNLACVLKSPLFGFDDEDLLALAPKRKASLLEALEQAEEKKYQAAAARIRSWQTLARQLSPFSFYMRVLGVERGRQRLLARLGPEAVDVLDEFLSAALTHEARGAPSLVSFLCEMETSQRPIKRDLDHAGDMVRVMTVHAAKGLEAKIVFLPDTGGMPDGKRDAKFYSLPRKDAVAGEPNLLIWSPRKEEDCTAIAQARQKALELAFEEHRRLLYVAMTRAEERLYIAGYHYQAAPKADGAAKPGKCWYEMVRGALAGKMHEVPAPWDEAQKILRLEQGATRGTTPAPIAPAPPLPLPDWLSRAAQPELPCQTPLRPSQVLTAADQADEPPGPALSFGLLRGQLIHKLLQHLPDLPAEQREAAARAFIERAGARLHPAERTALQEQVLNLLVHPELVELFGEKARSEVPICGEISGKNGEKLAVMGRIDRLLVRESDILLVDFKSGIRRASHIGQMALYQALLEQIYPNHQVKAALIWTEGPEIEALADAALKAALADITAA